MLLRNDIFTIGAINPNLRIFDIIMKTEFGTSYNAYLIKDEKTVLVETVHARYWDVYINNIREISDPTKIDYIIFNHTEPDHSGSLKELVAINPDICVVGSSAAIKNLKKITNIEFKSMVVKDGDTLNLGSRTLEFVSAPNLHWPDSMFTYSPSDKLVFTCDFLGAHYCEPEILDEKIHYPKSYGNAFSSYYQAIFSPFKKFVLAGLDKLDKMDVDIVCPSHGPVLSDRIGWAKDCYRQWSTKIEHHEKTALIVYVSAYGYTRKLAIKAAELLIISGYKVQEYDLTECDVSEPLKHLCNSDLLLIGSPTINRDALKPIWDFISSIDAISISGKPCGIFGSYGWSGEAVGMLKNRLTDLKMKVHCDGFMANFNPSDDEMSLFKTYIESFIKENA